MTADLLAELEATLTRVRSYRAALDHYTAIRPRLLAYERAVRPVMSGFDGLVPVFTAVRDDAVHGVRAAGARRRPTGWFRRRAAGG